MLIIWVVVFTILSLYRC